ncbi:MAG: beta-N-acetylglucosaminidase domain-containing protein, partial [Ginsengibacter sp.]
FENPFNLSDSAESIFCEINLFAQDDHLLNKRGAYRLELTPQKISMNVSGNQGLFYALQTLRQLKIEKGGQSFLPECKIEDFPDVIHRGTVEGFYGEPWSFEDRLEQISFYGKLKLNTYIYGPKDDQYHSSPNWRLPYPEEEANKIQTLVKTANNNYVDFVWAIHPGLDIQWTLADSQAVIKKFEMMYDLGVRNFAVFFDDITGAGTDARKQSGLLNHIQKSFVDVKPDVGPLIMCPTEYNKAWSNKNPGTYLDILGAELDPSIHIMWTGNSVVADIKKEDLEWVNTRIQRPAYVWWNFPVSDYVRNHLLMGPVYGLDSDAKNEMSGFVSNPMDKAEASKVGIFGVAMYAWNLKAFNSQQAWEAANRYVMPEAPQEFMLFNAHNSDLGPNGHGYRREESVKIKPAVESFLKKYERATYDENLVKEIQSEFDSISLTPGRIISRSRNKRLVEQMMPWLIQFELLGKSGAAAMRMVEKLHEKEFPKAWSFYLEVKEGLDSMEFVDKKYNQNPYQPGVKTGSLILTPFVSSLFTLGGNQFLNPEKTILEISTLSTSNSDFASLKYTNAEKLKNQPLFLTNTSISYSPVLESLVLQPGDYIGIKLAQNLKASEWLFDFRTASLKKWGAVEISLDGDNWVPLDFSEKNGKGKLSLSNNSFQYIRLINFSNENQNTFLREFKLIVETVNQDGQHAFALDGSLNTFETFTKHTPLQIKLPESYKGKNLIILMSKVGSGLKSISAIKNNKKDKLIYKGDASYIRLDRKKLKKINTLHFSFVSEGIGKVYEIIPVD